MTPYEVLRSYLHLSRSSPDLPGGSQVPQMHWGYHKHNMVTGPAPVATQILHAAGIAFASKLRKTDIVTIAYCGDSATCEADFLEGARFAAHHQLPMIILCEQDSPASSTPSSLSKQIIALDLPEGLTLRHVDGSDVLAVYEAMYAAMAHTRSGRGPLLLELSVTSSTLSSLLPSAPDAPQVDDPLVRCQNYMQRNGLWDEAWAAQLHTRLHAEVASALQDALREYNGQEVEARHKQNMI